MKKIIIPLTVISLFLLSCGNTANETVETAAHKEHQQSDELQTIELNNGEKWKVNAEMMIHVRNMENDLSSFGQAENKDYKLLATKLQSNIALLTSSCTMKGKAHDELHKWLLPFIDMVKKLAKADTATEAEKLYQDIQTSLITFNRYFQ